MVAETFWLRGGLLVAGFSLHDYERAVFSPFTRYPVSLFNSLRFPMLYHYATVIILVPRFTVVDVRD